MGARHGSGDMRGRVWICVVIDERIGLRGWEEGIVVFLHVLQSLSSVSIEHCGVERVSERMKSLFPALSCVVRFVFSVLL